MLLGGLLTNVMQPAEIVRSKRNLTLRFAATIVKPAKNVRLSDVHALERAGRLRPMERFEEQVKKALAKRLKQARKAAGFRFAVDFSTALHVEEHTYRSWERGEHLPDIPTLSRICKLLDVEPNHLMPLALKRKNASSKSVTSESEAA